MGDQTQPLSSASAPDDADAATSMPLGPGVKLKNRYVIERELGRGGIGVVYLAHDEELLKKRVVIKVLLEETVEDDWLKKKFQQEKEALARLDHPGVVGVLDGGLTPAGQQFLVIQFVEGKSLDALIKPNGMAFDQVARLLRQIGSALSAAHDEGIIHCDLKPANIMVQYPGEPRERARVIDFGVAKVRDSLHARTSDSTRVAGTLHYMAPEQIEGAPSAASDIFALGVIAYEMLTGRKPFNPRPVGPHKIWLELINLQRAGVRINPSDLRPDLPEAAQGAILKALAFAAQDRHPRASDFTEALAETLMTPRDAASPPPVQASQAGALEIAYVLFMDIVGYSRLVMEQQTQAIGQLQQIVRATPAFQRAQSEKRLIGLPTGDGMALAFFSDPIAPVECAQQISRALKSQSSFGLRMGVHTGPVYRVADINASLNVAGGGINIAQRVMDCGDAGHILLSKATAEVLGQLQAWAGLIHDLGECEVKHGVRVHLYNLYDHETGNPALPEKLKKSSPHKPNKLVIAAVITITLLTVAAIIWKVMMPGGSSTQGQATSINPQAAPANTPAGGQPNDSPPLPALELSVMLEAQKHRQISSLFDHIKADGTIDFQFEKGDGLRLQMTSQQAGFLYVFDDVLDNQENNVLMLFPAKDSNGRVSAFLSAGEPLSLPNKGWLESTKSGKETFWIVWSGQNVNELESLTRSARIIPGGSFFFDNKTKASEEARDKARDYLKTHLNNALQVNADPDSKRLNLKINNDLLVARLYKQ